MIGMFVDVDVVALRCWKYWRMFDAMPLCFLIVIMAMLLLMITYFSLVVIVVVLSDCDINHSVVVTMMKTRPTC